MRHLFRVRGLPAGLEIDDAPAGPHEIKDADELGQAVGGQVGFDADLHRLGSLVAGNRGFPEVGLEQLPAGLLFTFFVLELARFRLP